VDPQSVRLAQEEVFGPVLAVDQAKEYDQALEIANKLGVWPDGAGTRRTRKKSTKAKRRFTWAIFI